MEKEIPDFSPTEDLTVSKDAISIASISKYTANDVTIYADTDSISLVYLSDAWYPGWRATVNSMPAEIYRANYIFRAVVVPPGKNIVRFIYDNWNY